MSRGATSSYIGIEPNRIISVIITETADIQNTKKLAVESLQVAAGVPLACHEPDDFSTFRVGLFGLDKLNNVDRTLASLERAVSKALGEGNVR